MLSSPKPLCFIILIFTCAVCHGITTGDIVLNSTQGEKLSAQFQLFQADDIDTTDISIYSAGWLDYQYLSLEVPSFVNDLSFGITRPSDTPALIMVTMNSRVPITTNNSTVLLNIQWPNGRVLREYTLQFSTPLYQTNSAINPQPARGSANSPYTYQVKPGDSLWKIALKFKAANTVSIPEFIEKIQQSNPNVFNNGNINLLPVGSILTIPDLSLSDSNQGNANPDNAPEAKQANSPFNTAISARDTNSLQSPPNSRANRESTDRLSLITPQSDQEAIRGTNQLLPNLRSLLSFKQEDKFRVTRKTDELKDSESSLSQQITTANRLLKLKLEELARLQKAFQKQAKTLTGKLTLANLQQNPPQELALLVNTAPYYWNSWASSEGTLRSFKQLKTNQTYTIYLDLSGINYKNKQITSEIINRKLQNVMQRVTAQIGPTLELESSVVADPVYFSQIPASINTMSVDYKQVEKFDSQLTPIRLNSINPLTNKTKPTYLFESLSFNITTNNQVGSTLLTLRFAQDNQPLQVITLPIYIDK